MAQLTIIILFGVDWRSGVIPTWVIPEIRFMSIRFMSMRTRRSRVHPAESKRNLDLMVKLKWGAASAGGGILGDESLESTSSAITGLTLTDPSAHVRLIEFL